MLKAFCNAGDVRGAEEMAYRARRDPRDPRERRPQEGDRLVTNDVTLFFQIWKICDL